MPSITTYTVKPSTNDCILPSYRDHFTYSPWLTSESRVVVGVHDSVPRILDATG